MTTTGKRRRYPTADSINEFDDDNEEVLNSNSELTNKRRGSATADLTSHRLIVSERQQLAVLKQLTAGDESNSGSVSSCSGGTQQQRPTKIHRRNEHGETILHTSARKGDLKQLKKALKDNANVNEEDNAGWTPLHEAVTKNQFKAARLLLKSGANANAPGPERQTPLVDAVLNNNTKMVELLLNYSADTSVVDFSRLNEPMIKVLKREITTLDVSDNENDEDSLSPSSPMTSIDDSEHEEEKIDKNLVQSSSSSYISKKPFHHFHEYSSDSIANNKTYTVFNDLSRKNPYDFESDDDDVNDDNDDDDERVENSKQRTTSGTSNDSNDIKNSIHSFKEQLPFNNENIHRVPPLKIVLARTISHKNTDTESNNSSTMDDNSLMETLSLPIIEQNEKFLSTVITSSDFNNKVMTLGKKQDENILLSSDEKSSIVSNINELQKQSTHMIISTLLNDIITQIDPTTSIPLTLLKTNEIIQKEKQNELKITTRTLRSHAKGKLNTLISNQCSNDYRRVSNRRRILDKSINERFQRKKTLSEPSQYSETSSNFDDQTSENLHGKTESMDDTNTTSNDGINSIVHNHSDMDLLATDKRRLREKNTGLLNSTDGSNTINSSSAEENVSIETITRDIPVNGIKQFLEIRQQVRKLK
ncbi:unnamed protein product [Adineta steineri]|uniref:Uncharacterized protein n=1 Tax=Adineta steineri TaxID=433720 RepID=A0A814DIV1_9BILA|nr:unnamed protein product [Adineta steineri]CAF1521735.1 unnamed protein product [Adineta steineri]